MRSQGNAQKGYALTISTTSNTVVVQGNGLTTSFSFTFPVPLASELFVYYTDTTGTVTLLNPSTYSVTGIGSAVGGAITYPLVGSPIATGTSLTIQRIVTYQQLSDLVNQSGFYPNVVENALDYLTMQTQQLAQQLGLALTVPISATPKNLVLPNAAARASQLVGFDVSGNATTYPITASVGAGNLISEGPFVAGTNFTPGVTTTLTLSQAYGTPANVSVHFDTNYQGTDQYSLNGTQITFTSPIPVGVNKVYIVGGTTLSVSIPPSQSVGDAQLTWGNILNRVVDNVAAISGLNVAVYTRCFATGYYAAGDGGGGAYYYSSTSSATVNGGTVLAAAGGAGRWLLEATGMVSIKQFGAKGDGATDDTAAVQAAVTWATGSGVMALFVPAVSTNYRLTSTITITSGLTIVGEGTVPYTSVGPYNNQGAGSWFLLDHPSIGFNAVRGDGGFITTVRFSKIGTQRKHTNAIGVGWTPTVFDFDFIFNNAEALMEDVMLLNPYNGIEILNGGGVRGMFYNVRGQFLNIGLRVDVMEDVLHVDQWHNWPFWYNDPNVTGWQTANSTCFALNRCDNPFFSNIFSIFNLNGFFIAQNSTGTVNKLQGINLDFDQCQNWLVVDSTVTSGVTAQFTNVISYGPSPATSNGYNARIRGNNCRIDFIGLNGEQLAHGLLLIDGAATGNTINVSHARVKNWDLLAASFALFNIAAGNTLYIADRIVTDGTSGTVIFAGSGAIKYPQNVSLGNGTIPNGSTSVTINHGLLITPSINQIQFCMTTGVGSAKSTWISAVTATTFTVSCDVNPGVNISFNWRASLE